MQLGPAKGLLSRDWRTSTVKGLRAACAALGTLMRKLVIVVIVLVVIIVGALLALPHLIDVNQYRGQIQTELQQRLNRPVQLGELSLGVFPLRVEANNVTIGEDPSFHSNVPFAQVSQLAGRLELFYDSERPCRTCECAGSGEATAARETGSLATGSFNIQWIDAGQAANYRRADRSH